MRSERKIKPLVVVHPEAATDVVVAVLEKAGYGVVVSEHPEMFTFVEIDTFTMANMDAITLAALKAASQHAPTMFGRELLAALIAKAEPTHDSH